ncbi:unnamed protein product [Acanthosepion pharaonis]|uniref:Uncharacterized protein n=1 Tax=Acanthosepion pharaonis TaxID=158019 RepID=A0A812E5T7_ACAPH|nr:unnamed protein product [Sepia pharaonis]
MYLFLHSFLYSVQSNKICFWGKIFACIKKYLRHIYLSIYLSISRNETFLSIYLSTSIRPVLACMYNRIYMSVERRSKSTVARQQPVLLGVGPVWTCQRPILGCQCSPLFSPIKRTIAPLKRGSRGTGLLLLSLFRLMSFCTAFSTKQTLLEPTFFVRSSCFCVVFVYFSFQG